MPLLNQQVRISAKPSISDTYPSHQFESRYMSGTVNLNNWNWCLPVHYHCLGRTWLSTNELWQVGIGGTIQRSTRSKRSTSKHFYVSVSMPPAFCIRKHHSCCQPFIFHISIQSLSSFFKSTYTAKKCYLYAFGCLYSHYMQHNSRTARKIFHTCTCIFWNFQSFFFWPIFLMLLHSLSEWISLNIM